MWSQSSQGNEDDGDNMIRAEVRTGISDDEDVELFDDSNLNQQSFSDWSYAHKIETVKYSEKMIRKNFRQGKRAGSVKKIEATEVGTFVQSRQKSSY